MRTSKQSIRQAITTPLIGFGVVLLALDAVGAVLWYRGSGFSYNERFLLLLWALIIVVRVVLG